MRTYAQCTETENKISYLNNNPSQIETTKITANNKIIDAEGYQRMESKMLKRED